MKSYNQLRTTTPHTALYSHGAIPILTLEVCSHLGVTCDFGGRAKQRLVNAEYRLFTGGVRMGYSP